MCGYCVESSMIRALGKAHSPKVPASGIMLITHLQEVRDFPETVQVLTSEAVANPWVASTILCRAIEMLVVSGFESEEYQKLLQQPQFISAITEACAMRGEVGDGDSDRWLHDWDYSWIFDKDSYLIPGYFAKRIGDQTDLQCVALLHMYIDWWLEGGSVRHNDLDQVMEEPGTMDPIDDIQEAEQILLNRRFPILWFALLQVSLMPGQVKILWTIIKRNPAGVSGFDGLDLWLQRRATLSCFEQHGFSPFLKELSSIRPELIQYLVAVKRLNANDKMLFMERIAEFGSYASEYSQPNDWSWVGE